MGGGDRAFQSRLSLSNHTSVSQSVSQSVSLPGPTATTRLSTSNCHLSPEILHYLLHEKRAFKSQVKSSHFINNRQPNRKPIECVLSCLEASSGGVVGVSSNELNSSSNKAITRNTPGPREQTSRHEGTLGQLAPLCRASL